jgi:Lipocalin-like domain
VFSSEPPVVTGYGQNGAGKAAGFARRSEPLPASTVLTAEELDNVRTTAENRRGGMGDAERAALHKSMLAYSGKYRVEGNDFITVVDVSWNEEWNGTEQRRHFKIDGDRLFIESAPAPSIVFPGKTDFRRIVWEREK